MFGTLLSSVCPLTPFELQGVVIRHVRTSSQMRFDDYRCLDC